MIKKILVHTRRSMKFITIFGAVLTIIIGILASIYKVSYAVTIDGEFVGYTDNKSQLQKQINDYVEGEDDESKAFVQVDELPEYRMCLVKREVVTNDDGIFDKIQSEGTSYYRYYAILENQEEKIYVKTFNEAEKIVNKLKKKGSSNMSKITIAEKYETKLQKMTNVEKAVSKLYQKPKPVVVASISNPGTVNTSLTTSSSKVALGVGLIKPVSGIISSRFGSISSLRVSSHTGLDIATATGTGIKAAASGTVTFAGWKGSYGNLMVITHGNGVQTYYGHCSALYVTAGTSVSQGQTIGAVGSTGNSTGPHLHFEIRKNGVAYNPQNYLY